MVFGFCFPWVLWHVWTLTPDSPLSSLGKGWPRYWGGCPGAASVVTVGRVPRWRKAWWETGGGARHPDRYRESACKYLFVSGLLGRFCSKQASHFPTHTHTHFCSFHSYQLRWRQARQPKKNEEINKWKATEKEQVFYQINITQFIEPEVIDGRGDCWEIVGLEPISAERHGSAEAGQNPPIRHTLSAAQLRHTDDRQSINRRGYIFYLHKSLSLEIHNCRSFL